MNRDDDAVSSLPQPPAAYPPLGQADKRRAALLAVPRPSRRFVPVWRRNYLVWRKYLFERVLSNIVEPLITLVAFGYGLGSLLPDVGGASYLQFLASGSICMSVMYSAKFESLWGAYSRMDTQKTWAGIMNTPTSIDDILLGEVTWAASKALVTGLAMLLVIWALGVARTPTSLLALPLAFLAALTFSAMALIVNSVARGYDTLSNYFVVVVTPMVFLSGVFFPLEQLPDWLRSVARWLPLAAMVDVVRPLVLGQTLVHPVRDLALLIGYGAASYYVALARWSSNASRPASISWRLRARSTAGKASSRRQPKCRC
jgi:lipooligosaccharide transport system permease protein